LVNALLRRAQREGLPPASAADAWPGWLQARVRADWPADADAVFAGSARPAPTWLRVNRRRTTREASAARLREAGFEVVASDVLADALAPAPGSRVLDACAAPGGKSAHLLERDPGLHLLAVDVEPARLERVRDTWRRLGLGEGVDAGAEARVADAADPAAWWDGTPF